MDKNEILTLDLFVILRKKLKREFLNACDTEAKFDGPAVFRSSWVYYYYFCFGYIIFIFFFLGVPYSLIEHATERVFDQAMEFGFPEWGKIERIRIQI